MEKVGKSRVSYNIMYVKMQVCNMKTKEKHTFQGKPL